MNDKALKYVTEEVEVAKEYKRLVDIHNSLLRKANTKYV
jgi:hypothetical protein